MSSPHRREEKRAAFERKLEAEHKRAAERAARSLYLKIEEATDISDLKEAMHELLARIEDIEASKNQENSNG